MPVEWISVAGAYLVVAGIFGRFMGVFFGLLWPITLPYVFGGLLTLVVAPKRRALELPTDDRKRPRGRK